MRSNSQVLVFPAWEDNPFLNLLSLAARARGHRFLGATTVTSLRRSSERLEAGDVLHVHWTTPIIQRSADDSEARAALVQFRELLDELRRREIRLVWTVHNRLPHELTHLEPEVELYRLLAERADVVHIMAPDTPSVIADVCELDPARVREIPHPSFAGVYGGPVARSAARARLGIETTGPAVLFLGQLRPYKGLTTLFEALERLAVDGDAPALLLAGSASDSVRAEIEAALPRGVDTTVRYGFVPDRDVPDWFSAADLAVFPYRSILNSGSVHLAAAFDVPAVLPGETHLRRQFEHEPWVDFYDTADAVASLAETIRRGLAVPPNRGAFDAFNERHSPWRVSLAYAELLGSLA